MAYQTLFTDSKLKEIRQNLEDRIKESDLPELLANRTRCDFENALQIANETLTAKLADKNCPVNEAFVLAKHAFLDTFYPVWQREKYKAMKEAN